MHHPAPFPVELPARLIQLYTFEDDLVLDPFMGSGSTLVAAEPLGRRYVGYDLDEGYVQLARVRVAEARRAAGTGRSGTPAGDPGSAHATPSPADDGGKAALALAEDVLEEAGFKVAARRSRIRGTGVAVDFTAVDADGTPWFFDVSGPHTTHRGGMLRTDVAFRAIGRCQALAGRGVRPVVLLTTDLPRRPGTGDTALRAAGPGTVFDVVGIRSGEDLARLRRYAAGGHAVRPLAGFWSGAGSTGPGPGPGRSPRPDVPSPRTTVTELATGLGMLGFGDVDEALAARPASMVSVSPELWSRLAEWRDAGGYDRELAPAFANGAAFLAAREGLRDRRPLAVEWKGSQRAPRGRGGAYRPAGGPRLPGELQVPVEDPLQRRRRPTSSATCWPVATAGAGGTGTRRWLPPSSPRLYRSVRALVPGLPEDVEHLTTPDRRLLATALAGGWPDAAAEPYAGLCHAVAARSADRWRSALARRDEHEPMLWRILRMGAAPYFVLGATPRSLLRLRIATPWDWRQRYRLQAFEVCAQEGGQPWVAWQAGVRDVHGGGELAIRGHVEIRWSHGRFCGPPEAKVYLDTPHEEVPGYVPLS